MTDEEYVEYHNTKFAEIPTTLLAKAVVVFDKHLAHLKDDMGRSYDRLGAAHWFEYSFGHHALGRVIRNQLRDGGVKDDMVPDGNLDDYYCPMLEYWIGKRTR